MTCKCEAICFSSIFCLSGSLLRVMAGANEHCRRVVLISSSVPKQERAGDVAFGCGEFRGEDAAADFDSRGRIAKSGERSAVEAVLARGLPHHLHQSPGEGSGMRFGEVDNVSPGDL